MTELQLKPMVGRTENETALRFRGLLLFLRHRPNVALPRHAARHLDPGGVGPFMDGQFDDALRDLMNRHRAVIVLPIPRRFHQERTTQTAKRACCC